MKIIFQINRIKCVASETFDAILNPFPTLVAFTYGFTNEQLSLPQPTVWTSPSFSLSAITGVH